MDEDTSQQTRSNLPEDRIQRIFLEDFEGYYAPHQMKSSLLVNTHHLLLQHPSNQMSQNLERTSQ